MSDPPEHGSEADRLRSQLAEREAEVKRLREAGDALANWVDGALLGKADAKGGDAALVLWDTATGGTTDG